MKLFDDGEFGYGRTTNVGELIEKLKSFDPNLLVYSDGCDCIGTVVDVSLQANGTVLIERS